MVEATRAPLTVTRIPLADLVHDPANPRLHDDRNLASIQRSLAEHGQVEPLVVQAGTMMVVGGNGRMDAMRAMGWQAADCVVLDLTDQQARRMSIALNRTGDLAEWDMQVLAQHLDALGAEDGFDPDDLGFSLAEYDRLLADFGASVDPDPEPVVPADPLPPGTQPGALPSSSARMLQLYLSDDTEQEFRLWCKRLAEDYGTDNVSDTVYECLRRVARGRGWLEGAGETE